MSLLPFPASDWMALVGAALGLGMLIGLAEGLRKWGWASPSLRRLVHGGVGVFVTSTPLIFSRPGPFYLLAGAFVLVNGAAKWRHWWPSIQAARPKSWGTVTLPLALLPALAATWSIGADRIFIFQAAFLLLAVADPLASWIGQTFGRRSFLSGATVVGSGAFFVAGGVLTAAVLVALAEWPPGRALTAAILVGGVTTPIEAIGRRGWDNLTVVLGVILVLIPLHENPNATRTLVLALGMGGGFGVLARAGGLLDATGAVGGALFAASLVGLGGWAWVLPGLAFFFLSSALSSVANWPCALDKEDSDEQAARTLRQVLANGGVAWLFLSVFAVAPPGAEAVQAACYAGFVGALSAAAADTWATELGRLSPSPPWSLRTGSRVPTGTSGAVSIEGTIAAALGAGSVVGAALLVGTVPSSSWRCAAALIGAGLIGMGVDSVAGATLQARYREPGTGELVERPSDPRAVLVRGWQIVDNEGVNLIGTGAGAAAALLFL